MKAVLADVAVEALTVIGVAVGALVFTAVGMVTELSGVQSLQAGDLEAGLWLAYMGGIALVVGVYLLGIRTFLPAAARLWDRIGDRPV